MAEADKYPFLIRLHNLPRNASLGTILSFLWEVADFDPADALILAYSSKNCIVGFAKKILADDSVKYGNGRELYGRYVSVHEAKNEDLERVLAESKVAGPDKGPPKLGKHKTLPDDSDEEEGEYHGDYEKEVEFVGLSSYSDSEPDEMDLLIPDFFMKGKPPDTIDFARKRHSSGSLGCNGQISSASSSANSNAHSPVDEDDDFIEVLSDSGPVPGSEGGKMTNGLGLDKKRQPPPRIQRQTPDSSVMYRSPLMRPAVPEKKARFSGVMKIEENMGPLNEIDLGRMQQRLNCDEMHRRSPSPLQPIKPEIDMERPQRKRKKKKSKGKYWNWRSIRRDRFEQPSQQPSPRFSGANFPAGPRAARWSSSTPNRLSFFPAPPRPARHSMPSAKENANLIPMGSPRFQSSNSKRPFPPPPIKDPRNPPAPINDVQLVVTSTQILLKWTLPEGLPVPVDHQQVDLFDGYKRITKKLGREKNFLQEVMPGTTYQATIQGFDAGDRQLTLACQEFRASFSKTEMKNLIGLAEEFCVGEFYPFDILHRCKPRKYFDDIYNQPDGRRMMEPYLKDENGHPGSLINGKLNGFFFSTLLSGATLPNDSPFGDVQMVMDVHKMLDFSRMNMYFADFYCNEAFAHREGISSLLHYITIVVCVKGSESDRFCAERLILLDDPYTNKFLRIKRDRGSSKCTYLTNNTRGLLVEIYYTEPISLFEAKKFNEVTTFGKGTSRPMGLPNNKSCPQCNLPQR